MVIPTCDECIRIANLIALSVIRARSFPENELLKSKGMATTMRLFDQKDVIHLLRSEVKRAGNQTAWAKKTGVHRSMLNKILSGRLSPTKKIINLLKLRLVYVSKEKHSN